MLCPPYLRMGVYAPNPLHHFRGLVIFVRRRPIDDFFFFSSPFAFGESF